jgi:aminodeoxyfutalosine deaminase
MNMLQKDAVALRARWVVPVDRPPMDGGIVTISRGRILAVGENTSNRPVRDLGNVALLPGLVNAHTHLEFSLLRQPVGRPAIALPDWIRLVIDFRRQFTVANQGPPRLAGLAESHRSGVAVLGEIATAAWPSELPTLPMPDVVVFQELLGLSASRIGPLTEAARRHVAGGVPAHPQLRWGLSPHAPYTVHPLLLRQACQISAEAQVPLAMHLAESREELQLLAEHKGPLVELLSSLGAWHPDELPRGQKPLDYLRQLATAHRSLVVHGNYLANDEIAFLGAHRHSMSLVYCPRTHAYFGHEPYPLAQMLSAGVRVAVGTDSRASNLDLNLLADLRHIARHHPAVSPDTILQMGTLSGAEALGVADQFGSITPGKQALLITISLEEDTHDPLGRLLAEGAPGVSWVDSAAG